jgi:hypothetical protein
MRVLFELAQTLCLAKAAETGRQLQDCGGEIKTSNGFLEGVKSFV